MFSKTFFKRLRSASDIVFLTGGDLIRSLPYPKSSDVDVYELSSLERKTFLENKALKKVILQWCQKEQHQMKPALTHYAFVDIKRKIKSLHLMTVTLDGLHKKAGSLDVLELNGSLEKNMDEDFSSVRFLNEPLNSTIVSKVHKYVSECEIFVLCGVTKIDEVLEKLAFMAKGNGCYFVEVSEKESQMTRHCRESLIGDVEKNIIKLSMIIDRVF